MAAIASMPASMELPHHAALQSWTLSSEDFVNGLLVDPINAELRDEDVDLSDAESSSSSCFSPTASPSMKSAAGTPSTVSAVAEATGSWSSRPERRKRKRMSDEERKVRHREVQRQFMKRKRARIAELRKVIGGVEKQLRLVTVLHEIEQLKKENEELREQSDAAQASPSSSTSDASMISTRSFEGLVFSVPSEETHDDIHISEIEWDEIFDVLSDDGAADADADSDASSQC